MTQDTEDVVARLVAHGRKHGALLNADNEAWDAIDALLADRQSLSDRIDVLEEGLNAIIDGAGRRDVKWSGMNAHDIARAALALRAVPLCGVTALTRFDHGYLPHQ